jgi:hypothetical protein
MTDKATATYRTQNKKTLYRWGTHVATVASESERQWMKLTIYLPAYLLSPQVAPESSNTVTDTRP